MTESFFSRSLPLLGEGGIEKLQNAAVAVFGLGGVGSFTAEALARAGIGRLLLIDADTVSVSNINRQLVALHSTVGLPKVDVMAQRIADISPSCRIETYRIFYDRDTAQQVPLAGVSYVVDAIDSLSSKLLLAQSCVQLGIAEISCMGAGNKLDPTRFEVADISKTSVCPLARRMRTELRKNGIEHLKVVYSKEPPVRAAGEGQGRPVTGSVSFVPSVAGLILAAEVIKDIALG